MTSPSLAGKVFCTAERMVSWQTILETIWETTRRALPQACRKANRYARRKPVRPTNRNASRAAHRYALRKVNAFLPFSTYYNTLHIPLPVCCPFFSNNIVTGSLNRTTPPSATSTPPGINMVCSKRIFWAFDEVDTARENVRRLQTYPSRLSLLPEELQVLIIRKTLADWEPWGYLDGQDVDTVQIVAHCSDGFMWCKQHYPSVCDFESPVHFLAMNELLAVHPVTVVVYGLDNDSLAHIVRTLDYISGFRNCRNVDVYVMNSNIELTPANMVKWTYIFWYFKAFLSGKVFFAPSFEKEHPDLVEEGFLHVVAQMGMQLDATAESYSTFVALDVAHGLAGLLRTRILNCSYCGCWFTSCKCRPEDRIREFSNLWAECQAAKDGPKWAGEMWRLHCQSSSGDDPHLTAGTWWGYSPENRTGLSLAFLATDTRR
ncbi:hypothetical protein ANO11243_065990 [Dothideomycetidae sp. 11243]|nr:hypothetical protein ANO11243_065990 [fungal sp. No.11243]